MIGLGRMGANMLRRLARVAGIPVIGYDAGGGGRGGAVGEPRVQLAATLAQAVAALGTRGRVDHAARR